MGIRCSLKCYDKECMNSETDFSHLLHQASEALKNGHVLACPTETFYALSVRYDDDKGLSKVLELKQRPTEKAFPLIIGSLEQLSLLTDKITNTAKMLIDAFWPSALTLVFEAKKGLHPLIVSDNSVAVRLPANSFALHLAKYCGRPITSTSCNISGQPPCVSASEVRRYFEAPDLVVIDTGKDCPGGKPSTILDVRTNTIKCLRVGAISLSCIAQRLKVKIEQPEQLR